MLNTSKILSGLGLTQPVEDGEWTDSTKFLTVVDDERLEGLIVVEIHAISDDLAPIWRVDLNDPTEAELAELVKEALGFIERGVVESNITDPYLFEEEDIAQAAGRWLRMGDVAWVREAAVIKVRKMYADSLVITGRAMVDDDPSLFVKMIVDEEASRKWIQRLMPEINEDFLEEAHYVAA